MQYTIYTIFFLMYFQYYLGLIVFYDCLGFCGRNPYLNIKQTTKIPIIASLKMTSPFFLF